jgi:hypothetical protein
MADRKDYKAIIEELPRQGWQVEMTARGHYKATPPDPKHTIVHFSHSDDHHALMNIVRDLRKRGFVWPVPSRNEVAADRRDEPTTKLCPDCHQPLGADHICLAAAPPPSQPESPEARMDRLFHELKDAKVLAALTEEQLRECEAKLAAAQKAVDDARMERDVAAIALKKKKVEFDSAFEAAA